MLICVEFQMRKIQNVSLCKNEFLQRQTFLMNKSVILQYFLANSHKNFRRNQLIKLVQEMFRKILLYAIMKKEIFKSGETS
jgi:hypothetical protein